MNPRWLSSLLAATFLLASMATLSAPEHSSFPNASKRPLAFT